MEYRPFNGFCYSHNFDAQRLRHTDKFNLELVAFLASNFYVPFEGDRIQDPCLVNKTHKMPACRTDVPIVDIDFDTRLSPGPPGMDKDTSGLERSQMEQGIQNDLWARFVTLPSKERIWTLTITNKTVPKTLDHKTPLVMVHGFGGGVGLWIRNLDALSRSRPVYAFDLLGFGRSSRPHFPSDPDKAEEQFVNSIEEWRQSVGLENMILLGHSLGGYLATSYAVQYPSRVSHLILVDPWGFPEQQKTSNQTQADQTQGSEVVKRLPPPRWVKALATVVSLFNPLAVIRAAGPWGPGLVNRFRPDFQRKFEDLFEDDTMTQYIYHCNAQTPSGEVGFRAMSESLGWAKRPMLQRVHLLPPSMSVTMLYGARSWVDSSSGESVVHSRGQANTRVLLINNASHHVYADQPEEFNRVVEKICKSID